jgi:D-inositol-3-phosphate glycosyltransferase
LRKKLTLPDDKFLILLSSRISHEKDPETVIRATAIARGRGLDAMLINLGGGYKQFLQLAGRLQGSDAEMWVLGRPAAHPMTEVADYFRCADAVALASLAEGAAFSTLEALACGTPVVATDVGGMAVQLKGYARLTPLRDPTAMAEEFLWIKANEEKARVQALKGRQYVVQTWNDKKAFRELSSILNEVVQRSQGQKR